MRVNPRYLQIFCTVAEQRSLTRAAERLNLSQPAVTRCLKALESQVGQPLYERTPQGIILTELGRELLPYACAVSQSLASAARFVERRRRKQIEEIHLGISWGLVSAWTPKVLRRGESWRLRIFNDSSQALIEAVRRHELVAALTLGATDELPPPLVARRVGSEEAVFAALPDHPLASREGIWVEELAKVPLILPGQGSRLRARLEAYLEQRGIVLEEVLEAGSLEGVRVSVRAGLGLGLVSRGAAAQDVAEGCLVLLPILDRGFTFGVHWVSEPHNLELLSLLGL